MIKGRRVKVLGCVYMNLTAVDVTYVKGVRLKDEVALIGKQLEKRKTTLLKASKR